MRRNAREEGKTMFDLYNFALCAFLLEKKTTA
jgi:hypothetical protein